MKNLLFIFIALFSLTIISCEKNDSEVTEMAKLADGNMQAGTRAHTTAFAFVSSNTIPTIGFYPVGVALANPGSVTGADSKMIGVPHADADGIVYDEKRNALYQVNRTDNVLVAIANIDDLEDGDQIMPSAIGPSSFMNGREATIYNNKVVVADDQTPGRLTSYHVNENHISDYRQHQLDFEVWGIQATKKDLWAIVDVTDQLAYFENYFKATSGTLEPTSTVSIEGLVRTHGLNYDTDADVMVLTDIGSAGSADDGGLIIIEDFWSKYMAAVNGSGLIPMTEQIRIYGANTQLGNPVDVAIQYDADMIFVAERANGDGKFLVFEIPSMSGDYAPTVSTLFPGASAVTIDFE